MEKGLVMLVCVLAACLSCNLFCFADDAVYDSDVGRFQIYSSEGSQSIIVLLDTKTGKVWQLSNDMTGKLKIDGVTVEGLAFATKDVETLNKKIGEINLDKIPDSSKKPCRDKLLSAFSYQMDSEKIENTILEFAVK